MFAGRARGARPALLDGAPGALWSQGGTHRVAFRFTITDGLITDIEVLAETTNLAAMDVELV